MEKVLFLRRQNFMLKRRREQVMDSVDRKQHVKSQYFYLCSCLGAIPFLTLSTDHSEGVINNKHQNGKAKYKRTHRITYTHPLSSISMFKLRLQGSPPPAK